MVTDRNAELLAEIRASDDDQTRLVYADWLEERGDHARAMLIRRQCEVAALPPWDRRAIEARWEIDRLLAEHGDAWRGELPSLDGIEWLDFERGFVSSVRAMNLKALYRHASALHVAAPVSTVVIDQFDEGKTPAQPVPWLRTLRFERYQGWLPDETASLASGVEALELRKAYGDRSRVLAARTPDAPLRRLTIHGEHASGGAFATAVCALPGAAHLEELRLDTRFIDHDTGYYNDPTIQLGGALDLAGKQFDELRILELGRQRITSSGLGALIPTLPALRELGVRACELVTLEALANPGVPLVRLDASENRLFDTQPIATSPRTSQLESLALDTCELGAESIEMLVTAPCWQTLRVLDLSRNPLGVAGAAALAAAPRPPHLHSLKLADCDFDDSAARVLSSCEWLDQLLAIDLGESAVAADTVRALAQVRSVRLAGARISGERDGMLAHVWPHAVELDLAGLTLGGLLVDAAPIQVLSLAGCTVSLPRLQQLFSPAFPHLHRLNLAGCELYRGHLVELLVEHGAGSVRELDLRRIEFTGDQLVALARALAPRVVVLLHGEPWSYSPETRTELARLLGEHWQYHDDDPDEDDDADEEAEDEA